VIQFEHHYENRARIKVVGIGGGGGNAITTMIRAGLEGVEFIIANTDAQVLRESQAPVKIQLGDRGLGAGADPMKGRIATEEARDRLRESFEGADMIFITAGLGGGTGTGGAPVAAEIAKELGALTVAVVTKPFTFEGSVRMRQAEQGAEQLHDVVDTLISIPNDRLLQVGGDVSMRDAFRIADEVLYNAVRGISDLITLPGLVNLDFADVRAIMNEMGMAMMGTGRASGPDRAIEATTRAINNPLLEDVSIKGARGVLLNISGGPRLGLHEVNQAATMVREEADPEANIIFGAVIQEEFGEEFQVTVIATGLDDRDPSKRRRLGRRMEHVTDHVAAPIVIRSPRSSDERPAAEAPRPAAPAPAAAAPAPQSSNSDFMSPFAEEDELEVPAFIRRARVGARPDERAHSDNGAVKGAVPAASFAAMVADRTNGPK
jgi:cell division protein FtsZ